MPTSTRLRVCLDAGRRTPGQSLSLSGYNLQVASVDALRGVRQHDGALSLGRARQRGFEVRVRHMTPVHRYAGDDGHLTLALDREQYTISLTSLAEQGPVWIADAGLFITRAEIDTAFDAYRHAHAGSRTLSLIHI